MQPEEPQEFKQPQEVTYLPDVQPTPEPAAIDTPSAEVKSDAPQDSSNTPVSEVDDDRTLQWQASEYIQDQRSPLWYIALIIVVILLMTVAILWIKSWTFAILVPVMAVALFVYVRRPAAVINYTLSGKGLFINDTLHSFHEFKAFGVLHDGKEYSIQLIPVRRFRPSLSVYFPEESGEQIVDMLGVRLPMEQLKPDVFDKIVHFLRI